MRGARAPSWRRLANATVSAWARHMGAASEREKVYSCSGTEKTTAAPLGERRERAVGDRHHRDPAPGRRLHHVDHLVGVEAERHGHQQIPVPDGARHVGGEPAARVEEHGAPAQHRQHVAEELHHRRGAELAQEVDGVRLLHERHGAGEVIGVDAPQEVLERGDVAQDEVVEEAGLAVVAPRPQLGLEGLDARLKAGSGRREPLLEGRLEILEPLVAQRLGEAHEARGVDADALGDGVDPKHRHVVGVLRDVDGDPLVGLAHPVVAGVDLADEILVVAWRPIGDDVQRWRHAAPHDLCHAPVVRPKGGHGKLFRHRRLPRAASTRKHDDDPARVRRPRSGPRASRRPSRASPAPSGGGGGRGAPRCVREGPDAPPHGWGGRGDERDRPRASGRGPQAIGRPYKGEAAVIASTVREQTIEMIVALGLGADD